jgi:hypothetical protein
LADTDSFPTQESIRRFRGFIVDSVVLEHDGGRGRPKINAESVVAGLKQLKDCPLTAYLATEPTPVTPEKKP